MFCTKCGNKNEKKSQFCSSCGNELQEIISGSQEESIISYAGFGRRFIAFCIDSIVFIIAGSIFGFIFALIYIIIMESYYNYSVEKEIALIIIYIMIFIVAWLYYTLFESSSKQATLGKTAVGIIVTDINGGRISIGKANARYWSMIVSTLVLFIGFIMAGFTQNKQALHDIIAGTFVIKK